MNCIETPDSGVFFFARTHHSPLRVHTHATAEAIFNTVTRRVPRISFEEKNKPICAVRVGTPVSNFCFQLRVSTRRHFKFTENNDYRALKKTWRKRARASFSRKRSTRTMIRATKVRSRSPSTTQRRSDDDTSRVQKVVSPPCIARGCV